MKNDFEHFPKQGLMDHRITTRRSFGIAPIAKGGLTFFDEGGHAFFWVFVMNMAWKTCRHAPRFFVDLAPQTMLLRSRQCEKFHHRCANIRICWQIFAAREAVFSAGSLKTPQLLKIFGVGKIRHFNNSPEQWNRLSAPGLKSLCNPHAAPRRARRVAGECGRARVSDAGVVCGSDARGVLAG